LGGTASSKWSVTSPAGRFVLRTRPAEFADPDSTRFDHEIMLRLRNAGFPVPWPRPSADGRTWVRSGDTVHECLDWIAADRSSANQLPSPSQSDGVERIAMPEQCSAAHAVSLRALGSFLARFHACLSTDLPPAKARRMREDHPELMKPYLAGLPSCSLSRQQGRDLGRIASDLAKVG
jgi:Ser/Thr protein kinase RdoA (MazF antagonist)